LPAIDLPELAACSDVEEEGVAGAEADAVAEALVALGGVGLPEQALSTKHAAAATPTNPLIFFTGAPYDAHRSAVR
jgi:hypothetical protein